MEENLNYNKTKALFNIALVIIIQELVQYVSNVFSLTFITNTLSENTTVYSIILRCISIGVALFSIIVTFVAGYIFTKDKRKTVVFAGSVFLGENAAGLVLSLLKNASEVLLTIGVMSPFAMSTAATVLDIAFIPVIIALAYFVFAAFQGITSTSGKGLDGSELLLSRARTRYIAAFIIGIVVSGVISSAISFVFSIADFDYMGKYLASASAFIGWVGSVLSFVIMYLAGYRPYRSHIDALAFVSVSATSGKVSALISSALLIPQVLIMESGNQIVNSETALLLAGVSTAVSAVSVIVTVALSMLLLKFYFAPVKISLFEDSSDFSDIYQNSEAFTPTSYADTACETTGAADAEEEHTEE